MVSAMIFRSVSISKSFTSVTEPSMEFSMGTATKSKSPPATRKHVAEIETRDRRHVAAEGMNGQFAPGAAFAGESDEPPRRSLQSPAFRENRFVEGRDEPPVQKRRRPRGHVFEDVGFRLGVPRGGLVPTGLQRKFHALVQERHQLPVDLVDVLPQFLEIHDSFLRSPRGRAPAGNIGAKTALTGR